MKRILFHILLLFTVTGCFKEDLSNCWKGDLRIDIYAEKFQRNLDSDPLTEVESEMNTRIHSLYYYLYKDNQLMEEGSFTDMAQQTGGCVSFCKSRLPFGEYTLLLLGNVPLDGTVLTGDVRKMDELSLLLNNETQADDYFSKRFSFTIDCDCQNHQSIVMNRLHGVSRFFLKNLPENVTRVELQITGTTSQYFVSEEKYREAYHPVYRFTTFSDALVIGSFASADEDNTGVIIRIFTDGDNDVAVYQQEQLLHHPILPNQLVDVTVTLPDNLQGNARFEVSVDTRWDGSHGGDGDVDVN